MPKKITLKNAKDIANRLGIDLKIVPPNYWQFAMQIELEHGKKGSSLTNVTNDDLYKTGQIALAHILEFPDYYVRLKKLEDAAIDYWRNNTKPNILL